MGYVCASSRHVLPWDTICMASATQTGMTHGALGFCGVQFDVNNSSLLSVFIVHRFCALSWRWMARVGGSGFALQHSLAWFCMLTCVSDACNHFENRAPMLESTARHGARSCAPGEMGPSCDIAHARGLCSLLKQHPPMALCTRGHDYRAKSGHQ